jgi:hypothetical protein
MRIIITDTNDGEVLIEFEKTFNEEPGASFRDVYSRLMVALEGAITTILNEADVPDKKAYREHMYDMIDDGFGNLLAKVFPEIDVNEFNLTAAAIVYAQDQIIQKAEAEGKTYQQMLDEYEKIADKYIAEKRLH